MNFKYGEFFKYIEAEQSAASDQTVQNNGNNGVVNSVAPTNGTKVGNQVQGNAQPTSKEDRTALITKYVDNYFNKSNNGKTGDGIGWNYSGANEGTKKILDLAKKWTIDNLSNSTINMKTLPMEVSKFADSAVHQAQAKMAQDAEKQAEQGTANQGDTKPQNQEQPQEAPTQNPSDLLTIAKQDVSDIAKNLSTNEISIKVESKSVGSKLKAIKEAKENITSIGNFNVVITMSSQDTNGTENKSNEQGKEEQENQVDNNAKEAEDKENPVGNNATEKEQESLAKQFLKGKINEAENKDVSKSVSNIVKQIISSFGTREIGNETVQITNSGNATTSENNGVLTITVPMAIVRVDTKEKSTLGDKVQKIQNIRNQNADIALKKAQAKAMKTDAKARLAAAKKGKGSGGNILKNFSPYGTTSNTTSQSYTKSVL